MGRFGPDRLAHVQGAFVVTSEGGGDVLPAFEDPAEGGPAGVVTGLTQTGADHLHGLGGDDGDERMALGADGLAVTDWTQSGFGVWRTASISSG